MKKGEIYEGRVQEVLFPDKLTLQGFPKLRHFDNLSGKEGASDGR